MKRLALAAWLGLCGLGGLGARAQERVQTGPSVRSAPPGAAAVSAVTAVLAWVPASLQSDLGRALGTRTPDPARGPSAQPAAGLEARSAAPAAASSASTLPPRLEAQLRALDAPGAATSSDAEAGAASLVALDRAVGPSLPQELRRQLREAAAMAASKLPPSAARRVESRAQAIARALGKGFGADETVTVSAGTGARAMPSGWRLQRAGPRASAPEAAGVPAPVEPAPVELKPAARPPQGSWLSRLGLSLGFYTLAPWRRFDSEFTRVARFNVFYHARAYAQALAEGDSHVRTLQEFGWRFAARPEHVAVPSIDAVVEAYNRRMDELLAAGVVAPDEVLRPVRVFRDRLGRLLFLPFGAPVPRGARPFEELLGTADFLSMIEQGFFEIGGFRSPRRDVAHFSLAEHDLAHLTSFMTHPRYMAELRRGVRRLRNDPRALAPGAEDFGRTMSRRFFFVAELLTVIKPQRRERLLAALSLPAPSRGRTYVTVAETETHLSRLPDASLLALAERLSEEVPPALESVGGVVRDRLTKSGLPKPDLGTDLRTILSSMRDSNLGLRTPEARRRFVANLARLEVALAEFAKISPEQFAREGLNVDLPSESLVVEVMSRSGVFASRFDGGRALEPEYAPSGELPAATP